MAGVNAGGTVTALAASDVKFDVSFLFGGQIRGSRMRLFMVYTAGNFIECTTDTPYLQIGEHKYGKPVLDRAMHYDVELYEALKTSLISMDSTMRSNLGVGLPIDVRSTSLAVLACIAVIVFLRWAQDVLIPITFAVMLSYALTPVVDWLKRKAKLHKAVGAALTLALILGALGIGLSTLRPEALDILDIVPRATQKFSIPARSG